MSDDLYNTDIVEWSKRQAELLRRRAAGALVCPWTLEALLTAPQP